MVTANWRGCEGGLRCNFGQYILCGRRRVDSTGAKKPRPFVGNFRPKLLQRFAVNLLYVIIRVTLGRIGN